MQSADLFNSIRPRYPEFKDQVAVITGSCRGIGKGIALRLAREGMKIVVHGLDAAEVEGTTQEFQALGVETIGVQADFTSEDAINRVFQETLDHFGTLDLLVNNAADLRRMHLFDERPSLLDQQLAVNVRAPYRCAELAANIMRPKQRGSIINISSVGGLRAHWAGMPYDMTKGAIDAMTRSMALDLAGEGIRMNAIAPGAIRGNWTPPDDDPKMKEFIRRIPQMRFGTALEIGAAVAFLASDDARYIVGQILYVDGGITAQLSGRDYPV